MFFEGIEEKTSIFLLTVFFGDKLQSCVIIQMHLKIK